MISWMQKHNKYLIVTIWIATIAFIGAGFVGWGSYQYGSKASNIAEVGNIKITQAQLDMSYRNIYQRYNQQMQGQLDDKKAKELGLIKQAFNSLETQAKLLNLSNEFGIIVSDNELSDKIASIPSFQTNGHFDKDIYTSYLNSQRLKAKTFEEVMRNELVIEKTLSLLNVAPLKSENNIIKNIMGISDKISYKVIDKADINIDVNETSLKAYWEQNKFLYMTQTKYKLDLLWTNTDNITVTDKEIEDFYGTNSFNYTDKDGKQLLLSDAKSSVVNDLKLKKAKKDAQKRYIAFKKDKLKKSESVTININDMMLSDEVWKEIEAKNINSILKAKILGNRYVSVKIIEKIEPREMTFSEAEKSVKEAYIEEEKNKELKNLAQNTLKDFNKSNPIVSDFIQIDSKNALQGLTIDETRSFIQQLFISQKENDIISLQDKSIVYNILEQKIDSSDIKDDVVKNITKQIKQQDFESNLIDSLGKKYKTKMFVKGL
ncbi:Peptidyl-prolyl cis-trans isomerase PpiD [hydrothermal vent metagenome]|uniref:Peptidyl-prolyl cis-trans isomerase PpiD n=1 Tax=hydrothermal vent metagenome TaxID=652676 RepID=A0A1W1BYK5_9ZZZZ